MNKKVTGEKNLTRVTRDRSESTENSETGQTGEGVDVDIDADEHCYRRERYSRRRSSNRAKDSEVSRRETRRTSVNYMWNHR